MWRPHLAKIYHEVMEKCQDIQVDPSEKLTLDADSDQEPIPLFSEPCAIFVHNADAVNAAMSLPKPVILNLASPTRPGGGCRVGARAQEEELFRRTAYHKTLVVDFYPLQDDELVYSPSVPVLLDDQFQAIENDKSVAFIACAGLKWPRIRDGEYFEREEDRETTRRKVMLILRTAYLKGHTHLVLGAMGAGCFRGPPKEIAMLFKQGLEIYKHCFRTVVFAVLSHDFAPPDHGPLGQVFAAVLESDKGNSKRHM